MGKGGIMAIAVKKFVGFLGRIYREQSGIAAIPAAIGAVSLLTVAGVAGTFASGVVSNGTDASQEVEKAVHEAIQNIQDTYQIRGSIIGIAATSSANGAIAQLTFTVALASGGGAVDFTPPAATVDNTGLAAPVSSNSIIISYSDEHQHVENLYWTTSKYGRNDGDDVLEEEEMFQITIGGDAVAGKNGGNLVDALDKDLSASTAFALELKTSKGATMRVERRTPSSISKVVNLH